MKVVVIDYGLSNVGSVRRALEECGGGRVTVASEPLLAEGATHIVLPGVGAFAAGIERLRASGWDVAIRSAVAEGASVLGICLGMQLLADTGVEGGTVSGLGLVPGTVVRMEPADGQRLPHVGWNDVTLERTSPLFEAIASGTDFYFVHSYRFVPAEATDQIASVDYAGGASAAVSRGRTFGVQFHPEKSAKAGFQLLRNFLAI